MATRLYTITLLKTSLLILLLSGYRLRAQSDVDSMSSNEREDQEADMAFSRHHSGLEDELGRGRVPHVFLGILASNVAPLLANFFGGVDNLDYPKKSMTVW